MLMVMWSTLDCSSYLKECAWKYLENHLVQYLTSVSTQLWPQGRKHSHVDLFVQRLNTSCPGPNFSPFCMTRLISQGLPAMTFHTDTSCTSLWTHGFPVEKPWQETNNSFKRQVAPDDQVTNFVPLIAQIEGGNYFEELLKHDFVDGGL